MILIPKMPLHNCSPFTSIFLSKMVKNLPAMWEIQVQSLGKILWRREWLSTPVFLPREFHGQRSLAGYSLWDHQESDKTEKRTLRRQFYHHCFCTVSTNVGGSSPEADGILRETALLKSWIKIVIPSMKSLFLCLPATFIFLLLMLGRQCPLTLSTIDASGAKAIATQQSHKTISLRWFRYYNCYRLLVGWTRSVCHSKYLLLYLD